MPRYITVDQAMEIIEAFNSKSPIPFYDIPWCGDYGCRVCYYDGYFTHFRRNQKDYSPLDSKSLKAHFLSAGLFRRVIGEESWQQGIHRELFIVRNGKRIFGVNRHGRVVRDRVAILESYSPSNEWRYYPAVCFHIKNVPYADIAVAVAINLINLKGEDLKGFLKKGGGNHVFISKSDYYTERTSLFSIQRPVVVLEMEGKR